MGGLPQAPDPDRPQRVDLPEPVPVYMTYLTVAADARRESTFRSDPYRRDAGGHRPLFRRARPGGGQRETKPRLIVRRRRRPCPSWR